MSYDENCLKEICLLLGLSQKQVDYSKKILLQMEVKGIITIEEIRQFGELFPGSIGILSKTLSLDLSQTYYDLNHRKVFYKENIDGFLKTMLKTYNG